MLSIMTVTSLSLAGWQALGVPKYLALLASNMELECRRVSMREDGLSSLTGAQPLPSTTGQRAEVSGT